MRSTVRRLQKTNSFSEDGFLRPTGQNDDGEGMVISLLNKDRNAGAKRVAELVEAFRRADQLMESIKASADSGGGPKVLVNDPLMRDINERLSKYQWLPAIFGFIGTEPHFKARLLMISGKSNDALLALEQCAIQWLVDHVDAVHRIRRCHLEKCRKWFFAKTDHQKYCGDNCRQRDAAQGESFKAKRRIYMKKYRRAESERDARAKRLAKGKSK
jgi:hypothetical protein